MSAAQISAAIERGLITPDEGEVLTRLEADASPEGIAEAVLTYHAIQPHWTRNRAQVAELIAEAVRLTRAHDAGAGGITRDQAQTSTTQRVNETTRAREAWHNLNDAMEAAKARLIGADDLPTEAQAADIARASEALIQAIHAGRDARYWRAIKDGAPHADALRAQEG
jgi:hypothetical protein